MDKDYWGDTDPTKGMTAKEASDWWYQVECGIRKTLNKELGEPDYRLGKNKALYFQGTLEHRGTRDD